MKAITLTQPWAELVALGVKQFETRSWRANYRGLLAIHASRDVKANGDHIIIGETIGSDGYHKPILRYPFGKHIPADYSKIYSLGNGCIECVVRLIGCYPAERVKGCILVQARDELARHDRKSYLRCMEELEFGDFSTGRWAWNLQYVARVSHRGIVRGHQGLWNVPEDIERQILPYVFRANVLLDGEFVDYAPPSRQLRWKEVA